MSRLRSATPDLRIAAADAARRPARRGDLPQGEDAEGRHVQRTDYTDVRDRLQDLRAEARGEARATPPSGKERGQAVPAEAPPADYQAARPAERRRRRERRRSDIPGRNRPRARFPRARRSTSACRRELSSDTAQVEDRFEATTVADLYRGNDVLIPAGSVLRGVVQHGRQGDPHRSQGQLTVAFDQITVRGRTYPMRGTVTQALESEGIKGRPARIGAGAGVGAIIGGILGGVRARCSAS